MGRSNRAKAPRYRTFSYKEHRELSSEGIKTAMLLQLVAMADELKVTEDELIKVMTTAMLYSQHVDNNAVKLKDAAISLYKSTGIDLRLRRMKSEKTEPMHLEMLRDPDFDNKEIFEKKLEMLRND